MQQVPWSQTLVMAWRPALRYHEQRYAVLRQLTEASTVAAFRVQVEDVGARLADHELELSATGLSLHLTKPDVDLAAAEQTLRITLELIDPTITRLTFVVQYLAPLGGPYDEMRSTAAESLVGAWVEGVTLRDCATVFDAVVTLDDAWSVHVEAGVLAQAEIPQRFSVPLAAAPQVAPSSSTLQNLAGADLPETAYYAGFHWTTPLRSDDRLDASRILAQRGLVDERGQVLAGMLRKGLLGEDSA